MNRSREMRGTEKGANTSTEEGRAAEISVDLVLQARAHMADNKVNGPEDSVVSEMIKQLPSEKIFRGSEAPQGMFYGVVSKLPAIGGL